MYQQPSIAGIADVMKKGSGAQLVIGIIILVIGVGIGLPLNSILITYLAIAVGIAITASSFLIIIKQYERGIILRLGKYKKQVGLGVQTRLPFADSVLVVDIREKVREFKAESCLQEIMFL
jgi:regulator of protease activity HflC (stomatin/prohibitin superfamily)